MITNIRLVDSVFWTTHVVNSSDVVLSNLNIWGDYNIPNNDGIDIVGCQRVIITECIIDTEDEVIETNAIQKEKKVLIAKINNKN